MATQTENQPTWNLNPDKNGIEIRFPRKPHQDILDLLNTQRFTYSWRKVLWYAKDTPANRKFAIDLTNSSPIPQPENFEPKPRKRKPPKFLVVLARKRKPKAITKRAAEFWRNHPDKVRFLYQVPGEWRAREARIHIKQGHPLVKILLGPQKTKAAQRRVQGLSHVIQELNSIYEKYNDPPGAYRIVLVDRMGMEYKYDPRKWTADKITGPALTQGVDIPLKELLSRSQLVIRVQAYDDLIVTRQHGASIRRIGRTLEERPLGRH